MLVSFSCCFLVFFSCFLGFAGCPFLGFAGLLFLGSTMLLSAVTIAGAEIRVEPRIPPLAMLGWIVLGMFAAAAIGIAVAARQLGAVDPPAVLRVP